MSLPSNFEDLIIEANTLNLYKKLILQLNKDLLLANIDLEFNEETLPTSLKLVLQDTVIHLIQSKFSDYLNLLYQVDVSELKIRSLEGADTIKISEDVAFLILQREWQKVWYRSKNQ
ncbi:hypothetical protein H8K90_06690 [Winogradskyella echinorum]|uniref:Uncharacterized protein n=1 Tax=Winogradskyella echinorum TaxID=538189 RepID=A0ABR6XZY8_9FLAO|nr:hypothetical protein [Winogradskyella echinorum]MBC3846058.1 hypothetical protein [Winogradskyella echinorum]MBC5750406.1 hypothetical protein [Winogradskyella echinorum]